MGASLTDTSGEYAIKRLKNMLIADRIGCDFEAFSDIKKDIYHTISKYFETNPDSIRIRVQYQGETKENDELFSDCEDETTVCVSIPVKKYSRA